MFSHFLEMISRAVSTLQKPAFARAYCCVGRGLTTATAAVNFVLRSHNHVVKSERYLHQSRMNMQAGRQGIQPIASFEPCYCSKFFGRTAYALSRVALKDLIGHRSLPLPMSRFLVDLNFVAFSSAELWKCEKPDFKEEFEQLLLLHLQTFTTDEAVELERFLLELSRETDATVPDRDADGNMRIVETVVETLQRRYPDAPRTLKDLQAAALTRAKRTKGSVVVRDRALSNYEKTFKYWRDCISQARLLSG